MHESTLAKRYAIALADLADEQSSLELVSEELKAFCDLLNTTPSLRLLFVSPTTDRQRQKEVLTAFLEQASVSDLTGNFLKLFIDKRRMMLVDAVLEAYGREVAIRNNRVTARISTPQPLTQTHTTRLVAALKKVTRKEVSLDIREDARLLGGLVVQIGSLMMDFSVRNRLNQLTACMTK